MPDHLKQLPDSLANPENSLPTSVRILVVGTRTQDMEHAVPQMVGVFGQHSLDGFQTGRPAEVTYIDPEKDRPALAKLLDDKQKPDIIVGDLHRVSSNIKETTNPDQLAMLQLLYKANKANIPVILMSGIDTMVHGEQPKQQQLMRKQAIDLEIDPSRIFSHTSPANILDIFADIYQRDLGFTPERRPSFMKVLFVGMLPEDIDLLTRIIDFHLDKINWQTFPLALANYPDSNTFSQDVTIQNIQVVIFNIQGYSSFSDLEKNPQLRKYLKKIVDTNPKVKFFLITDVTEDQHQGRAVALTRLEADLDPDRVYAVSRPLGKDFDQAVGAIAPKPYVQKTSSLRATSPTKLPTPPKEFTPDTKKSLLARIKSWSEKPKK